MHNVLVVDCPFFENCPCDLALCPANTSVGDIETLSLRDSEELSCVATRNGFVVISRTSTCACK